MKNKETADIVALARSVCAAPIGILSLTGSGWTGTDGVDPADLERIAALSGGASGFFETTLAARYCAGWVLRENIGVLCVLDDLPREPLTAHQRELLRALGDQLVRHIELQRTLVRLARLQPLGHLTRGIAHEPTTWSGRRVSWPRR